MLLRKMPGASLLRDGAPLRDDAAGQSSHSRVQVTDNLLRVVAARHRQAADIVMNHSRDRVMKYLICKRDQIGNLPTKLVRESVSGTHQQRLGIRNPPTKLVVLSYPTYYGCRLGLEVPPTSLVGS